MSKTIDFEYVFKSKEDSHYEFIIDGKSIGFERDSFIKTVHSKKLLDYKTAIYDRIRSEVAL